MTGKSDEHQSPAMRQGVEGAPEGITVAKAKRPAADVSNADVDLSAVSFDSTYSTVVDAPDQNPEGLRPAPGPQRVEVLGMPDEG